MDVVSFARSFYSNAPQPVKWTLGPVKSLYEESTRVLRHLKMDVWLLSEIEPSKASLTVFFAGGREHKNYMAKLAFGDSYDEVYLGRRGQWSVIGSSMVRNGGPSVVVIQTGRTIGSLLCRGRGFFVPLWVGGAVDLSGDPSSLVKTHNQKEDVRRIRKNNLEFEVTTDPAKYDFFYEVMYMPYITKVHGNAALPMRYETMKGKADKSELLLVKKGDESIAGVILLFETNIPQYWSFGVRDGNCEHLRTGAMGAAVHFAMHYLQEKGYSRMHFGASRAFLKDGVLQFKSGRGMEVIGSRKNKEGFMIKPLSLSDGVKGFLSTTPFIHFNEQGLIGAFFTESDRISSGKDIEKICRDHLLKGMDRLDIFLFGSEEDIKTQLIPAELRQKVTIRSAERLFG